MLSRVGGVAAAAQGAEACGSGLNGGAPLVPGTTLGRGAAEAPASGDADGVAVLSTGPGLSAGGAVLLGPTTTTVIVSRPSSS